MDDHNDEHEAYASARSASGPYVYVVPDAQHEESLDLFVDGDESSSPLMVLGERQSGKTALLSNWLARRRERARGRGDFVFAHFVGCTPRSLYLRHILWRLMAALKDQFDLREMDVPKSEERLRWGLSRFLSAADRKRRGEQARIVVVVDGANWIRNEDAEQGKLHWLPTTLPGSVRFVLSTTEFDDDHHSRSQYCVNRRHRTFTELSRRKCPSLQLSCLSLDTRRKVVDEFFAKHFPAMDKRKAQQERITDAELSSQPTFLRLLLSTLRLEMENGGNMEKHLDEYLGSDSADRLLAQALTQWAQWVEPDTDDSLKCSALIFIICAIQASRNGLSRDEMWGLVKFRMDKNLSPAQKEKIARILEEICIVVDGLYLFSHSVVKRTLFSFIIKSPSSSIHDTMAKFFGNILTMKSRSLAKKDSAGLSSPKQPSFATRDLVRTEELFVKGVEANTSADANVSVDCDRQLSCIVWHLEVAGMWGRLKEVLVDIRYFHLWCQKDEFINLWASLLSSKHQGSEDDVSLVTGPFCSRTMLFHRALRPVFDPVEEFTKSLDVYRTKHGMTDSFLRRTVVGIAVFLFELCLRGHEELANVPAFHHPHLPMEEMCNLGVPHIDYEESTFVTPIQHGSEPKEEKEDRLPITIDDRSPVRSSYFFHRFVWIHYPIMSLDDRAEMIKKMEDKSAETDSETTVVSSETPADNELLPNKRAILPSIVVPEARKRPRTGLHPLRKREDGATDDVSLLNQLKSEYDCLVQRRLRQSRMKEKLCTDMLSQERDDINDAASRRHDIEARQKEVLVEQEVENELHSNYKSILKSLRRNPAHVPSLIKELECNLQESSDLIQVSRDAINIARYETTSASGQFHSIHRAQQDAQNLYWTMISHRSNQRNQIRTMVQEEEAAFEAMSEAIHSNGNLLSPEMRLPRPSSRRAQGRAGAFHSDTGTASNIDEINDSKSDNQCVTVDEIKDRTGIGSIGSFASRITDECGEVRDHINEMRTSSENRISSLKMQLEDVGKEYRALMTAIDARAATEDEDEETVSISLEIEDLEEAKSLCDEKNDSVETLLLSLQDGIEGIACSLGLSKVQTSGAESLIDQFKQVDSLISLLLGDKEENLGSGVGVTRRNLDVVIDAYHTNQRAIASRMSAGPLHEVRFAQYKEQEENAKARIEGDRVNIKTNSKQLLKAQQARVAKELARKKRQEAEEC